MSLTVCWPSCHIDIYRIWSQDACHIWTHANRTTQTMWQLGLLSSASSFLSVCVRDGWWQLEGKHLLLIRIRLGSEPIFNGSSKPTWLSVHILCPEFSCGGWDQQMHLVLKSLHLLEAVGGSSEGKIGGKLCLGFKFPGGLDLSFAHFWVLLTEFDQTLDNPFPIAILPSPPPLSRVIKSPNSPKKASLASQDRAREWTTI